MGYPDTVQKNTVLRINYRYVSLQCENGELQIMIRCMDSADLCWMIVCMCWAHQATTLVSLMRIPSFISGSSSGGWAGQVCEHFSCRIKKIKNTIFYFLLILELLIADRRITMSLQTKLKRLIEKSDFLSKYQLKNLIERHF